jgi:hypothetical protein
MVAAGADVLVRSNRHGTWAWAGLRLHPADPSADPGVAAAPDEDRAAAAESAWLAAQWTASGPARFEVRYRNVPGSGLLECALLCRVQVATSSAAVRAAHADRDSLAADLPVHVRSEPIADRALVRDWLTPFAGPVPGGQVEFVKDLAWLRLGGGVPRPGGGTDVGAGAGAGAGVGDGDGDGSVRDAGRDPVGVGDPHGDHGRARDLRRPGDRLGDRPRGAQDAVRAVREGGGGRFHRDLAILVPPFSSRRVSWEPALRELARLPFRAVLSIGFAPFNATPAFRLRLNELAREYADLAALAGRSAAAPEGRSAESGLQAFDAFAAQAAAGYETYGGKYTGAAFQVRMSLAAEGPLSDGLGQDFAALLSGPRPATREEPGSKRVGAERGVAIRPPAHERAAAWSNFATLGAAWLADTYRRGLPDEEFGAAERTLMTLVDVEEARSVLHFPFARPGQAPLFTSETA